MFKLNLEKTEESEIKLPTSTGSSKKEEFWKNIFFCFIDYAKAFDCVDHNKLWKSLKKMGLSDHPYLTYMQSTSSEMLDWMNHKLESRLPREISVTSDMQMITTLIAGSEEELKSLLMSVKERVKMLA